jgi:hypothetical protein
VGDSAALSEANALGKAVINAFLDGIDVDFSHSEEAGDAIGAKKKSDSQPRRPIYTLGNGLKASVTGDSNSGICEGEVWYENSAKSYIFFIDDEEGINTFPTS